jgi:hypothetical protein
MSNELAPISKQELIGLIVKVAREMNASSLAMRDFCTRSGLTKFAIGKHFDSWHDACVAAGISDAKLTVSQLAKARAHTRDECIQELKRVATLLGSSALSSKIYDRYGKISSATIRRLFGGWHSALSSTGLEPTSATGNLRPMTPDECIKALQEVANKLGQTHLTVDQYDKSKDHGPSSYRIVKVLGLWHEALQKAGLRPSPQFIQTIPLQTLAEEFLRVSVDLGRIPTLHQLTRRSDYVSHTFGSGKPGGYREFKLRAIDLLLSSGVRIPPAIKELFVSERSRGAPTWTPDKLRALSHDKFEEWAVTALGGNPNAVKVADKGIDGRIPYADTKPDDQNNLFSGKWYPVQVKQQDAVDRPVIDSCSAMMDREHKTKGFIVAFSFTSGSHNETLRLREAKSRVINLITVQEILDGTYAKKL